MADNLETIRDVINDRLRGVNTCIPGRIESYNASTRKAEVQPLIQEKYADGQVLTLPKITGVPVVMQSTSSAGLVFPVANGDPCLLLFAQRSIDQWLSQGGIQQSADKRMHAMSDAIAILGLFPFSESHSDGSGVRLHNDDGEIRIEGSGDVTATAGGIATLEAGAVVPGTFKAEAGKIALGTSAVEVLANVTKAFDEIAIGLAAIPSPNVSTLAASAAIKTITGTI